MRWCPSRDFDAPASLGNRAGRNPANAAVFLYVILPTLSVQLRGFSCAANRAAPPRTPTCGATTLHHAER